MEINNNNLPCPHLVVDILKEAGIRKSRLLCRIPAYEDVDTSYCDEYVLVDGEIKKIKEGEN